MSTSLRLSEDAVPSSSYSLSDEALRALQSGDTAALIASHRDRFGGWRMELDDEDDDDQDDDADDGDDDEEDDDDADDDEDEDDSPEGGSKKKPKSKQDDKDPQDLESAKRKIAAQQDNLDRFSRVVSKARKERDDAQAELAKLKKDGVSDDSVKAENEELKSTNVKLSGQLQDALLRIAFLSDNSYDWQSPAVAMKLADLKNIEITDEGEVVGLKAALEELASQHPYLLKKNAGAPAPRAGSTGKKPPRKTTAAKQKAEQDRIREKYRIA